MTTELEKVFERLMALKDPHARGRKFESFILQLFQRESFEANLNSGAARPRQTDLYAGKAGRHYLVETKWTKAPFNIDDISALRDRLRRAVADFSGIVIALAGMTESAERDLGDRRNQMIHLIGRDEVLAVIKDETTLTALLDQKEMSLRRHGKVWSYHSNDRSRAPSLVRGTERFTDRETLSTKGSSYNGFVFSHDPSHTLTDDSCHRVSLEMRLGVSTPNALAKSLDQLAKLLRLVGNGPFQIGCNEASWQGFGQRSLLREIRNWKNRHRAVDISDSRREEVRYFDAFPNGQMELSLTQHLVRSTWLGNVQVRLWFSGVPLNTAGLQEFAKHTRNESAFFEPRIDSTTASYSEKRFFFKKPLKLDKPISLIVSQEFDPTGQEVSGVIVANPFVGKKKQKLPEQLNDDWLLSRALSEAPELICSVTDRIELDDVVDGYWLHGIRYLPFARGYVIVPEATWGTLLHCPHRGGKITSSGPLKNQKLLSR